MMLRRRSALALLLLLGCATKAPPRLGADKLLRVDQIMVAQVEQKKIAGGVVGVVYHGEPVFSGIYGKLDLEAKTPMRMDAIFRLYSMTKAIVCAAAMTLVDEGKLSVD